jgi:hypothetical protein
MMTFQDKSYFTTKEVCEIWNRSMEAVRQKVFRKVIEVVKVGNRLYLDADQVNNYYPKKRGLPPLAEAPKEDEFFTEEAMARSLSVSQNHLRQLIRQGKLKAYCDTDGKIYIPESSLGVYMGVTSNDDANSL